jgi:hypothetical protein
VHKNHFTPPTLIPIFETVKEKIIHLNQALMPKGFIEVYNITNARLLLNVTSIAIVEDTNNGTNIVMKEKDYDGKQIIIKSKEYYNVVIIKLNQAND